MLKLSGVKNYEISSNSEDHHVYEPILRIGHFPNSNSFVRTRYGEWKLLKKKDDWSTAPRAEGNFSIQIF